MVLHMVERGAHIPGTKIVDLAGHARVLRLADELLPHPQTLPEQLAVAVVAQKRDGHAPGAAQDDAQNVDFTARKVGITVQIHVFSVYVAGLLQMLLQLFQPVAGVAALRVELGEVDAVEQRDVPQLVPGLAGDLRHRLRQRLRRDGIGDQLLHHVQQAL